MFPLYLLELIILVNSEVKLNLSVIQSHVSSEGCPGSFHLCSCESKPLSQYILENCFILIEEKHGCQQSSKIGCILLNLFWKHVQSLFFLNLKFQVSSHPLCLYSPISCNTAHICSLSVLPYSICCFCRRRILNVFMKVYQPMMWM